jgi:hypothetical protein
MSLLFGLTSKVMNFRGCFDEFQNRISRSFSINANTQEFNVSWFPEIDLYQSACPETVFHSSDILVLKVYSFPELTSSFNVLRNFSETIASLEVIHLNNFIEGFTDEGCSLIAEYLEAGGCFLKDLGLSRNHIKSSGLQRIMNSVLKYGKLRVLDLSWNEIDEDGFTYALMALSKTNLQKLDLSWNYFQPKAGVNPRIIQNCCFSGEFDDLINPQHPLNNGDWYQLDTSNESALYYGKFQNGNPHGRGSLWVKGNFFKGEWVSGKMHGYGIYHHANGNIYEGFFEKGRMHGEGKFTYQDGRVIKGFWEDGKPPDPNRPVYGKKSKINSSPGPMDANIQEIPNGFLEDEKKSQKSGIFSRFFKKKQPKFHSQRPVTGVENTLGFHSNVAVRGVDNTWELHSQMPVRGVEDTWEIHSQLPTSGVDNTDN